MPKLELAPYGYDVSIDVEGQVLSQTIADPPLLVLLDEDHNSPEGIGENLRTALKFVKANVVDFVGVEETPAGVRENVQRLAMNVWKAPSLEAYSASLRERFSNEDQIVDAAIKKPDPRFGRILLMIRPTLFVFSVDDVKLCAQAEEEHERLQEEYELASVQRRKDLCVQFSNHPVHRERDKAFVANLFAKRQSVGATRAIILNAGGRHNDRIPDLLSKQLSVVRIRPTAYVDATSN